MKDIVVVFVVFGFGIVKGFIYFLLCCNDLMCVISSNLVFREKSVCSVYKGCRIESLELCWYICRSMVNKE